MRADLGGLRYNEWTSPTLSPTIDGTIGDASSTPRPWGCLLADGDPDTSVWDLMSWPQRQPTYAEICWVAGLFEGDGSFGGRQLQIDQKDPEVLYEVRRLMGGRVIGFWSENTVNGGIRMHKWYAQGARGRGIARTLHHLLSTRRREQARVFLRIPRGIEPPMIDRNDPTSLLWDWTSDEEIE